MSEELRLEIDLINGTFRYHADEMFGIKRFISGIQSHLSQVHLNIIEFENRRFGFGSRLDRLINDYIYHPVCVRRQLHPGRVRVITAQSFLYLLTTLPIDRCIVICHDLLRVTRMQDYPSRMNVLLNQLSFRNLSRVDRIVTVSNYTRQQILSHFHVSPDRITVVPNAVDHNLFRPEPQRRIRTRKAWGIGQHPVILYVGSEEPRKNIDVLLKAVAQIRQHLPSVRLIKIGRPQYPGGRERFLRLAKSLGLLETLKIIDYLPDHSDGLAAAYNAADVFLFPSLDEGFGLPPLEAMASGTPVVASNVTAIPEVVGTGGILISPQRPEEFAEAALRLLCDGTFRKHTVQKGLTQAKRFNWEESAQRMLSVYQAVASEV